MQFEMKHLTLLLVLVMSLSSFVIQKIFKKYLESDQYHYLKEVTIVGVWALMGIWASDGALRITIATSIIAACIGFCQKVFKNKNLKFLYLLLALGYSIWGPQITFIEFSNGEYYNLSYVTSILISIIWLTITPLFLQGLDETPGICGIYITFTWILILTIVLFGSSNFQNLSYVFIFGLIIIFSFWSRHLHPYRRLTEPLSALWGTLISGLSIFAISSGTDFLSLTILPCSLYVIPVLDIVISIFTVIFFENPKENFMFYKSILKTGANHINALLRMVFVSCIIPLLLTFVLYGDFLGSRILIMYSSIFLIIITVYKLLYINDSVDFVRKPKLWGIEVDNISLNFALSKVENLIFKNNKGNIIVTPDALAALRSRTDKLYSNIIKNAALVLPDGAGLILALKLLGTPIQERIPGVEFTEHLCKKASYEGWGVWFLGGLPGIAEDAAKKLKEKFPSLIVSGVRNGFFDDGDINSICSEISESNAKILFVGLGVPKQEYWLSENIEKTGVNIGMGIGGTMDVISGKLNRAPKIWQMFGMEWLYRVIQEPYRWRRVLKLPIFLLYVFLTLFHMDFYKETFDISENK
ncbi:MAG: WecB/TagA/CpsF family glycosyltransferase [Synergistaceae bacterium]